MTTRPTNALTDALESASNALDFGADGDDYASLVDRTFEAVVDAVGHDACLYADVNRQFVAGRPSEAYDAATRPDLVVDDDETEVVVTVADHATLVDRDVVVSRLEGLAETGARRVLVVPDDRSSLHDARNLADAVDGEVTVSTPEEVVEHLGE